jgi:hypothetical protein
MKKLLIIESVIGLLLPVFSAAQTDFSGTWKIDLSKSVPPPEPEIILLQNGIHHCRTCVPKVDVKADGQDQSITRVPYYDTIGVRILDDRGIEEVEKKGGRTVRTERSQYLRIEVPPRWSF